MSIINAKNLLGIIPQTSYNEIPINQRKYLTDDLIFFLQQNPQCNCQIIIVQIQGQKNEKIFQIRGKLNIKLSNEKQKYIGFKILLPKAYPIVSPIVILDEQEDPQIIEMVDYLDKGNIIQFQYLIDWNQKVKQSYENIKIYNLTVLIGHINQLFTKVPPLSFDELFGSSQDNQEDQWERLPTSIINGSSNQQDHEREMENFQDELLDDFDPMIELQKAVSENQGELDSLQRKSIWKKNFQMKNDLQKKQEKLNIINNDLLLSFKDMCIKELQQIKIQQAKDLFPKINQFETTNQKLSENLDQVKEHNQIIKQAIPDMDQKIKELREQIEQLEKLELNSEVIQTNIFKPKDEISEKIIKLEIKKEALDFTIHGLKSVQQITNLKDWLKNIRTSSEQQFKTIYKLNRLKSIKTQVQQQQAY